MDKRDIPSLKAFLAGPIDAVHTVAPPTVVYTPGGTRRQAVLSGMAPHGSAYARWAREQTCAACELLFAHGVRHVVLAATWPRQWMEIGPYRETLNAMLGEAVSGPEAMADYARIGCRVRLVGRNVPESLRAAQERLEQTERHGPDRTIWWSLTTTMGEHLTWIMEAGARGVRTRQALVADLYGEDVPLATIWISSGKPLIAPDLLPVALVDELQCYWLQRPGYVLTERTLRQILYDYAYLRPTWRADKTDRYTAVHQFRDEWERAPTLGIGRHLGGFWYPE